MVSYVCALVQKIMKYFHFNAPLLRMPQVLPKYIPGIIYIYICVCVCVYMCVCVYIYTYIYIHIYVYIYIL